MTTPRNRALPSHGKQIIRYGTALYIYGDVGKRRAECRSCGMMIHKGERRVGIRMGGSRYVKTRSGFTFSHHVSFLHYECYVDAAKTLEEAEAVLDVQACRDCRRTVNLTASARVRLPFYICDLCMLQPKYKVCAGCRTLSSTRTMTFATGEEIGRVTFSNPRWENWLCDRCCEGVGVHSAKIKARKEKAEIIYEERYSEILKKIIEGEEFL